MTELDRPSWCPDPACACLTSYDERICVGRMPHPVRHDELRNTHNLCLDEDQRQVNDADFYYLIKVSKAGREDIMQHGLPADGKGERYDFSP